jgi:preprotein translocase subunit SecG
MFTFIIVLIAILALLMGLIILLQSGKGGGLAAVGGTGATRQVLGSRQAPDLLEKATWVLGGTFIALCILSNFFIDRAEPQESILQRDAQRQQGSPQALPPADQGAAPLAPPAGDGAEDGGGGAGNG